jgi:hypothetical protein
MYHIIEFVVEVTIDLEVSRSQPLEKVCIRKGTRLKAEIKPYVMETKKGPIEVADLYLENGKTTRGVAFGNFMLVD